MTKRLLLIIALPLVLGGCSGSITDALKTGDEKFKSVSVDIGTWYCNKLPTTRLLLRGYINSAFEGKGWILVACPGDDYLEGIYQAHIAPFIGTDPGANVTDYLFNLAVKRGLTEVEFGGETYKIEKVK